MAKNNQLKEDPIIWKDRRRRMGLPLSFTRYYIKNNRFYLNEGFFNSTENEMLLYRILDINMRRTLWDKMCGVGTLTLFTADETHKKLIVKKIKKPALVRDTLSKLVEEERTKLKISGKEMYGVSDNMEIGDIDGDGDNLFD
jgi:uncharacterized membrane protein YdbT with pleckstrin-like domain